MRSADLKLFVILSCRLAMEVEWKGVKNEKYLFQHNMLLEEKILLLISVDLLSLASSRFL